MKKLIMVISLASIVSCTAIPEFPEITCTPISKLSDKQLSELSQCKKDKEICSVPRNTLLQILGNYQNKSACLETYQETAKQYK